MSSQLAGRSRRRKRYGLEALVRASRTSDRKPRARPEWCPRRGVPQALPQHILYSCRAMSVCARATRARLQGHVAAAGTEVRTRKANRGAPRAHVRAREPAWSVSMRCVPHGCAAPVQCLTQAVPRTGVLLSRMRSTLNVLCDGPTSEFKTSAYCACSASSSCHHSYYHSYHL